MAAPWRPPLDKAIAANGDAPPFLQLATVKLDGRPSCRTIVFRGFQGPERIAFYGDYRTRKVAEGAKNPWGEIAWWFPASYDQFRLTGKLHYVCKDEPDPELQQARVRAWREMKNADPGRQHPQWPHPRTPRVADDSVFKEQETSADDVSDNFMVALFDVQEVDHYALSADRRTIHTKQPDGSWTSEAVNP